MEKTLTLKGLAEFYREQGYEVIVHPTDAQLLGDVTRRLVSEPLPA